MLVGEAPLPRTMRRGFAFPERILRALGAVSLFWKVLLANGLLVLGSALAGMILSRNVAVEGRPLDVLFGSELVVGERQRPDVAHPHLDVRALVARREVVEFEKAEQIVADLDQHPFTESGRL